MISIYFTFSIFFFYEENYISHNRIKWTSVEKVPLSIKGHRRNGQPKKHSENVFALKNDMQLQEDEDVSIEENDNEDGAIKSGEAWIQEGGAFEVTIEMDPDDINEVSWWVSQQKCFSKSLKE